MTARSGGRQTPRRPLREKTSRSDELVPTAGQVAVLVHDRIPYRDVAHALPECAAVACAPGLLHQLAEWVDDVGRGRLAAVPVVPFSFGQEFLSVLRHRRIVAFTRDERALEARGVAVHVFVEAVELEPAQMLHRRQCVTPAAISLLQRLENTRD